MKFEMKNLDLNSGHVMGYVFERIQFVSVIRIDGYIIVLEKLQTSFLKKLENPTIQGWYGSNKFVLTCDMKPIILAKSCIKHI